MDVTHRSVGSGHTRESAHRNRVLMSSSGNAQHFRSDRKRPLDSRKPYFSADCSVGEPRYPTPIIPLGSNDRQASHNRLAARKAKKVSYPSHRLLYDRAYLHCEKYKNYRERKRQDAGKDGEPVWPDHIEESFQNALVQIPPMGRKKRTQYGKPHGRNELIAEWIFQETGVERCRKQVSSHIQVLSNLLKGVPEWEALTHRQAEDAENEPDFYFESIADQVRLQRQLMAQARAENGSVENWLALTSIRHNLAKLEFDMWVGTPEDVTKALHNYTRASWHAPKSPASVDVPLEEYKNWRSRFPDLEATLQSSGHDQVDLVFVKSKFSLMSDFPPKTSKLGLVLNLDFRSDGKGDVHDLGDLKCWSSVNHMYLNGQPFRKTEHKECARTETGIVKPFFEAEWWASQFTNLTHRRKEAEDSKDASALASADNSSRNLFRSLTIMQEIFASPYAGSSPALPLKRVAILLWVFTQASEGHSGVTTWQRVVAPPSRMATNSPASADAEATLPPLIMDSMIENSFDADMMEHDFSHHNTEQVAISPTFYGPGTYHSGFTPLQTMSNDHLRIFDFSTATGFTPKETTYTDTKYEQFDFSAPIHPVASFPPQDAHNEHDQMAALFDLPVSTIDHETIIPIQQTYHMPAPIAISPFDRRHSLANFDMSTHQMLQAQLGEAASTFATPAALSEPDPHQPIDSQQSMIGHMNNLDLEQDEMSQALVDAGMTANEEFEIHQEKVAIEHAAIFDSPRITRPPLLAHNSFAGVLHTEAPEPLTFDTPVRNDFERLINIHYEHSSPGDLFAGHAAVDQMHFPSDFHRPRSQPVLPSRDHDQMDALRFDTPHHNHELATAVKTEQPC